MDIGNFFVQFLFTYYILYVFRMIFNKKKREFTQMKNNELNKMRKIPVKSLEEQKRFLDLKYPKSGKFKWSWKILPRLIITIIIFIFIYKGWDLLFEFLGINIKLWLAIIIILLFPLLANYVLSFFGLEKSDWRVLLR